MCHPWLLKSLKVVASISCSNTTKDQRFGESYSCMCVSRYYEIYTLTQQLDKPNVYVEVSLTHVPSYLKLNSKTRSYGNYKKKAAHETFQIKICTENEKRNWATVIYSICSYSLLEVVSRCMFGHKDLAKVLQICGRRGEESGKRKEHWEIIMFWSSFSFMLFLKFIISIKQGDHDLLIPFPFSLLISNLRQKIDNIHQDQSTLRRQLESGIMGDLQCYRWEAPFSLQ